MTALGWAVVAGPVAADWPEISPQELVYLPGYGGPGQSLTRILTVEPLVSEDEAASLEGERSKTEVASDPLHFAKTRVLLGSLLRRAGRWQESARQLRAAIEWFESNAADPEWLVRALVSRGRLQRDRGDLVQARASLQHALAISEDRIGPDTELTSHVLEDFGVVQWRRGEHDEAAAAFERALAIREHRLGARHAYTFNTKRNLAMLLEGQDRLDRLGLRYGMDLDLLYAALYRETPPLERAEGIYRELLDVDGVAGPDRAWVLARLAAIHLDLGSFETAAHFRREVRDVLAEVPVDAGDAEMLLRIARILALAGTRHDTWSKTAQTAEAAAIEAFGEFDPRRVDVTHWVGVLHEIAGFPGMAAQIFYTTAWLRARMDSPNPSRLAADLTAAGRNAWAAATPRHAATDLGRAVEILERLGPGSVGLAESLMMLAVVRAEAGAFEEAGRLAERGLGIAERQLSDRSPVRMVWPGLLARSRRSVSGRDELLAMLESAPAFPDRELVLAQAALRDGRLDDARRHLVRDLKRYELALGLRIQRIRERWADRPEKGQWARKSGGPDISTKQGRALNVMTQSKSSAIAIRELLEKKAAVCVANLRAFPLPFKPCRDAGHRSAPERVIAGGVWLSTPMNDRSPWFFETLGALLRADGHTDVAVAVAKWGKASWTRKLYPTHPSLAPLMQDLAEARWDAGQDKRALDLAREASEGLDRYLHDAIAVLPEGQALNLIASRRRPETLLFSGLLASRPRNADPWLRACWDWTIRRRALVLDELAYRHQVAERTPETQEAWERWSRARERLASVWIRAVDPGAGDPSGTRLADAVRWRNEAEAALARVSARYRALEKLRRASFEEIARALPPDAALVEYVRVPVRDRGRIRAVPRYVSLVLRGKRGKMSFVDLGAATALDQLVREWHRSLKESFRDDPANPPDVSRLKPSGSRLRTAVWDPVAAQLRGVRLVFVVLDGALNQVNLAALPAGDGYLIEEGPAFHYLSTGRDLVRLGDATPGETSGAGLLALGNPDFDASNVREVGRGEEGGRRIYRGPRSRCSVMNRTWSALPGSGAEARDVVAVFGDREESTILTGAAASEIRLKRDAPGKRILHLATHGFFIGEECPSVERSSRGIGGLVEAAPVDESASSFGGENPLLLSGLVLAGANRETERPGEGNDGILTAEELATMDLRGTELVALSACDTGLGTVQSGEGVFGLRRALEIAGARSVLMSLWSVPDEPARRWMRDFYRGWLDGRLLLDATRQASLKALRRLRDRNAATHPYLWAGFVAAGDWR